MRTLHTILFTLLLLLTLSACKNQQVEAMLDQAESIMQERPVEALSVLRTIDATQLHARSQEARYAMLYTQAQYKNYIDTRNDSLIRIAYDYYVTDLQGTDHDRMLSALMLGVIQKQQGLQEESMISLQRSLKYGQNTDDEFMLGQICALLSSMCSLLYDSDALKYAELSYSHYNRAQKYDYAIDARDQIANALYNQQKYRECLIVSDSVFSEAEQTRDTFVMIKSLRNIVYSSTAIGEIEKAKTSHYKLSQIAPTSTSKDLISMAGIYAFQGIIDSAMWYLKQAEALPKDLFNRINFHNRASVIYQKMGNYKEALYHCSLQHEIQDSLLNMRLANSVTIAQRDFAHQELEAEKLKERQRMQLWVFSIFIIIIIFVGIIIYFKRQQVIIKLEMEGAMMITSEIEQALQTKQTIIDSLSEQVSAMKANSDSTDLLVSTLFSKRLDVLNGLFTSYFSGQNKLFEKNSIYKEVQNIVKGFSEDEESFAEVESMVNLKHGNILQTLKNSFPKMKEADYKFLCFTFAGLSTRAISLLLDESLDNIYQKRSRWKVKIDALKIPEKALLLSFWSKTT